MAAFFTGFLAAFFEVVFLAAAFLVVFFTTRFVAAFFLAVFFVAAFFFATTFFLVAVFFAVAFLRVLGALRVVRFLLAFFAAGMNVSPLPIQENRGIIPIIAGCKSAP
ncbi:MAG: hypothetical protein AAGC71_07340 [Pseudomonadota bacterium]